MTNGLKVRFDFVRFKKRCSFFLTSACVSFKVYYIPVKVFYNQCVLPTIVCSLPLIRYIFIREEIQIIHGHSAFSALAHEWMLIGRLMGLKVSFLLVIKGISFLMQEVKLQ